MIIEVTNFMLLGTQVIKKELLLLPCRVDIPRGIMEDLSLSIANVMYQSFHFLAKFSMLSHSGGARELM